MPLLLRGQGGGRSLLKSRGGTPRNQPVRGWGHSSLSTNKKDNKKRGEEKRLPPRGGGIKTQTGRGQGEATPM